MDENSPNKMSEGSDPNDFHADEVIDYLKTASDFEKERVAEQERNGKNRTTVLEAAKTDEPNAGATAGTEGDNPDSEPPSTDGEPEDEEDEGNVEDEWEEDEDNGLLFPHEGYDPREDPDVQSTVIADNIRTELRAGGGSRTLYAVKSAKAAQDQ